MVETLSSLVTILSASSPFSVAATATTGEGAADTANILNPDVVNQGAVDIAYTFYPPANISLLASTTAAALLNTQED